MGAALPHGSVLAVGYLSIDTIATPGPSPEGLVHAARPGGAALYAALGARAAGAASALCACAGEDYPQAWLDAIAALGIDVGAVERRAGGTRRVRIRHGADGARRSAHPPEWWERTNALSPPLDGLAPSGLGANRAQAEGLPGAGSVAVAAGPMPLPALARLVELARARAWLLAVDTSEAFAGSDPTALLALVPGFAAFAPSREETRLLLPGFGDDEAVRALARLGPAVLQTRGAAGAAFVPRGGGEVIALPAPALPPPGLRDPTGAGDATLGALAAGLAAGLAPLEAARAALRAGALAVTGVGPEALGLDVGTGAVRAIPFHRPPAAPAGAVRNGDAA